MNRFGTTSFESAQINAATIEEPIFVSNQSDSARVTAYEHDLDVWKSSPLQGLSKPTEGG
jgi:hypothetical protein